MSEHDDSELPSFTGMENAATIDQRPAAAPGPAPVLPAQRYTLLRPQGRGGMGRVWLARDHLLGRDVALKELRPDCAEDQVLQRRLIHEAQVTGQRRSTVAIRSTIPGGIGSYLSHARRTAS